MAIDKSQYGIIQITRTEDVEAGTLTYKVEWNGNNALVALSMLRDSELIHHIGDNWIQIGPYMATVIGYQNGYLIVSKD